MGIKKDINELFEGDFSNTEKAAVAKKVMEIQNNVRNYGTVNIVLSALFCVVCLILAVYFIINFHEIVEEEMDPRAVPTSRNPVGKEGVAQDIVVLFGLPFSVLMPVTAAVSAEKDNKLYREFTARKLTVSNVAECDGIKGLYTVTANYDDNVICFNTTDSAAKNYTEGSSMIVVDFVAIKASLHKKSYDYYTASPEERRIMALRQTSTAKYTIVHI